MTFVGRATELEQFQVFLHSDDDDPWVMIITGMECIGKSALLEQMQKQQSEDTLYVCLDFAVDALQTDIFHFNILEKIAEAISHYSDAERYTAFETQLDRVRNDMAELNRQSAQSHTQSIIADHSSTVTHVTMSNDAQEYIARGKSINVDILKTALRRELRTFTQKRLVILLDNFEWLLEQQETHIHGQLSADHWLINTLLPELHDYLSPSQFFVIITTRIRPYFEAIKRDDLYYVTLPMLSSEEVQQYLEKAHLPQTWLPTINKVTMGHGLSITLFREALKDLDHNTLNTQDEITQQAQHEHITRIFYEKAWDEFVNERILQRLTPPFNDLIRYGVIPDSFNLPLLRYLFTELWKDASAQNDELQDTQIRAVFEKLLLYPCISSKSQQDYSIHPLIRTILLKHLEKQDQERLSYYQQRVNDYKQKTR